MNKQVIIQFIIDCEDNQKEIISKRLHDLIKRSISHNLLLGEVTVLINNWLVKNDE